MCKDAPETCLNSAPCTVNADLTTAPHFSCDCTRASNGGAWTGPRCETSTGTSRITHTHTHTHTHKRTHTFDQGSCDPNVQTRNIASIAVSVHPCDPNPCNNGTCSETSGSSAFTCHCDTGFTGTKCETSEFRPVEAFSTLVLGESECTRLERGQSTIDDRSVKRYQGRLCLSTPKVPYDWVRRYLGTF